MPKNRTPTEREVEILQRNGIDPKDLAIVHSDDDCIRALRYETRDTIVVWRGDKKW